MYYNDPYLVKWIATVSMKLLSITYNEIKNGNFSISIEKGEISLKGKIGKVKIPGIVIPFPKLSSNANLLTD